MSRYEPNLTKGVHGGVQKLYRFDNDYGASVVRHSFSYGGDKGKWELAVIVFTGKGDDEFSLSYDTPITDDVLGYLSQSEVDKILSNIEALPLTPPLTKEGNDE